MTQLKRTSQLLLGSLENLDVMYNYKSVLKGILQERGVNGLKSFHKFVIDSMEFINKHPHETTHQIKVEDYVAIYKQVMYTNDIVETIRDRNKK